MISPIFIYLLLIINVDSFIINKFINKHNINLSYKKSNKFKNIKNIDYFDEEFNDIKYNLYSDTDTISNNKYLPIGINQQNYVNYLNNDEISLILALGPAGSGKTLFACIHAIKALRAKSISKIILTRPIVAVEDEEIGYLPGNIQHKMDPWTKPIFDILSEYYKQYEIDYMLKESIIEISPLSFMRGRTFKNSIIIADEMQNSTPNQMLMLTTRVGNGSKLIITGDLLQSDRLIDNGLSNIIMKINNYQLSHSLDNIKIIEMSQADIQRSELVKNILDIYNN